MQEWAQKSVKINGAFFDVLSDIGNKYATQLGISFVQTDAVKKIYEGFDLILPRYNGDESWTLPMPARFVIDASGTVIYADINPDYTQRPDPSETLKFLKQVKVV